MSNHLRAASRTLVLAISALLASSLYASELLENTASNPSGGSPQPSSGLFEADHLRQGKFTYQLSLQGKPIGVAMIEIRATQRGNYQITFGSKDVEQSWTSTLDRRFSPIEAKLEMLSGRGAYSMSVSYTANKATGTERVDGSVRTFSTMLEGQVVDQRVDWAAMMAATFPSVGQIEFLVFDPSTSTSRLVGRRSESGPVDGTFRTLPAVRLDYTIHKGPHAECYTVFATRDRPCMMLREEMPGELVSQLIAVED